MEASKVTKETLTYILLGAVVIITLGLLLYDFIPTETEMPDTLEYAADAKVTSTKQAIVDAGYSISDGEGGSDSLLRSYTVTQSDLAMYKNKKIYQSGKVNPFEEYKEPENVVNNNTTNTSGGATTTNTITPTVANQTTKSTTGTFFEKPNSK